MTDNSDLLMGKFDKGVLSGYTGEGSYVFENCKYIGEFKDGFFHGKGTVYIKTAGKWQGTWENGKLTSGSYVFSDGLEYKQVGTNTWDYCSEKDPRFYEEIKQGNPNDESGIEYDCPRGNTVVALPSGTFDFGEGYYDPKKLSICSFTTSDPIRVPTKEEKEFIVTRCRKG